MNMQTCLKMTTSGSIIDLSGPKKTVDAGEPFDTEGSLAFYRVQLLRVLCRGGVFDKVS